MASNKTSAKNASVKSRVAIMPQRSHGKARVAAVLEAAAAVIADKGYDAATMAEIAAIAKAPIGSLYRFFPNKEILADALVPRYAELVKRHFDGIDALAVHQPIEATADAILDVLIHLRSEIKAMLALLEARTEWSAKRLEFRQMALRRIAQTLQLCAPTLPKREANDIAVILLHNMKMMKALKFGQNVATSPGAPSELRRMNRLYLLHRLGKS